MEIDYNWDQEPDWDLDELFLGNNNRSGSKAANKTNGMGWTTHINKAEEMGKNAQNNNALNKGIEKPNKGMDKPNNNANKYTLKRSLNKGIQSDKKQLSKSRNLILNDNLGSKLLKVVKQVRTNQWLLNKMPLDFIQNTMNYGTLTGTIFETFQIVANDIVQSLLMLFTLLCAAFPGQKSDRQERKYRRSLETNVSFFTFMTILILWMIPSIASEVTVQILYSGSGAVHVKSNPDLFQIGSHYVPEDHCPEGVLISKHCFKLEKIPSAEVDWSTNTDRELIRVPLYSHEELVLHTKFMTVRMVLESVDISEPQTLRTF